MARDQHPRIDLVDKIFHLRRVPVAKISLVKKRCIPKTGLLHNLAHIGIGRVKIPDGNPVRMQIQPVLSRQAKQLHDVRIAVLQQISRRVCPDFLRRHQLAAIHQAAHPLAVQLAVKPRRIRDIHAGRDPEEAMYHIGGVRLKHTAPPQPLCPFHKLLRVVHLALVIIEYAKPFCLAKLLKQPLVILALAHHAGGNLPARRNFFRIEIGNHPS